MRLVDKHAESRISERPHKSSQGKAAIISEDAEVSKKGVRLRQQNNILSRENTKHDDTRQT